MSNFRKHIQKKLSGYEPEVNDRSLHENWKQTEYLLNKQNDSRQRLNNFEPDVDDAHIDAKWNAIVPYLPEEKKRRAVFYIPPGCLLPGLSVLVPLLFFMTYYFIDLKEKPVNITEKRTGNGQHISTNMPEPQKQTPSPGIKMPVNNTVEQTEKRSGTTVQGKAKTSGQNSHLFTGAGSNITGQSFNKPSQGQNELPENADSTGSVCALYPVQCYPGTLSPEPLLEYAVIVPDSVPVKKAPRLMVDVTAGMGSAHTIVRYDSLQDINHYKTNLSLSAALHYRLNNRVWLSSQVTVRNNRYEYRSADTKNFILSRLPSTASSSPGSIDSSIKYMPFNRTYLLRSVFNCQAGLGAEVRLINKNKFSLSAALLMQLSVTQFNYSYSYQPSGDTLSYTKQASSPQLPNITKDAEPESKDIKYVKTNFGLYPGLVIGYRLTNRADLIVKPGMYVDLKELKPRYINYRETIFLLTAGLRVRL